jgi:RimJ/RimL family protein N-acetyltransferase
MSFSVETERLLLRPWRTDDGVELQRLFSDAAVAGGRRLPPDRIASLADRIEVGFELHQAWWGRGLATEAARAALRFGFDQHGLDRIISVTAAAHTAARRVMEKAGLTYQGTRYWMNPEVPVVWYAIDRAAWHARRKAEEAR